jgi:hypothetical protein
MNNFEILNDYLTGKKFSNGLTIKWEFGKQGLISRLRYLSELCKGKNIIHLGCLDHNKETIRKKMADNTWLHKILTDVSSSCLGIDIDPSLIDEIKSEMGIDNVICSDISTDVIRSEITSRQWDYLVCGEIIEHVDNPAAFLSSIRNKYASCIKQIIVTVPNSLNLGFVKNAFKTVESINTDHRYSFTPYNISKILVISGYYPTNINTVLHFDPKDPSADVQKVSPVKK